MNNFFFIIVILSLVNHFFRLLERRETRMFTKETLINANKGLIGAKALVFN